MPPDASVAPQTSPANQPAAPPVHRPSRLRLPRVRWTLWGPVVGVLILVVCVGVWWLTYRMSHSITNDAFLEAHIVNVAPQTVSGRLVRFLVDENDRVELGQVLAEIEPVNYQDQVGLARSKLELAEADLRRQEAALAKLRKEVPLQVDVATQALGAAKTEELKANDALTLTTDDVNKSIDEAKAAVQHATANLIFAKQEYDRFTQLAIQDATTQRKAEEVTQAHDAAKAELRVAEARLAKAEANRTKVEVAKRDLEAARISVAKAAKSLDLAQTGYDQIRVTELMIEVQKVTIQDARISLETAQHQLEFTQVRAPFPGVVVKRYRSLGDTVSPGVPLLSMYNPDLIYVTANMEEDRLRGVAPGSPVTLDIDAFDRPFKGRVVWLNKSTGAQFALMPRNIVAGEFTKVVQRVPVRIWIERDERWPHLRAGLSARVVIEHGNGDAAWAAQVAKDMAQIEMKYNRPDREHVPPSGDRTP